MQTLRKIMVMSIAKIMMDSPLVSRKLHATDRYMSRQTDRQQ